MGAVGLLVCALAILVAIVVGVMDVGIVVGVLVEGLGICM